MTKLAAATLLLSIAASGGAAPLELEPLLQVGQSYPGMPGVVEQTTQQSCINNSGQWVSRVSGNHSDGTYAGVFVVAYDGIRYDPFTPVAFDETTVIGPSSSGRHSSINNLGQIATTISGPAFDHDGNFIGGRSMILLDNTVVLRSGDPRPFGGVYGAFGASRHTLDDSGRVLANFAFNFSPFSTDDTTIEFAPSPNGYEQTVRAIPGMPVQDGYFIRHTSGAAWGSFDLNNSGDTIVGTILTNDQFDVRAAVLVNGSIAQMTGETDLFPDGYIAVRSSATAINDQGNFAYHAFISSSEWKEPRLTVMRNEDEVVWINDGSDPLLDSWNITGLRNNISITSEGDVYWQTIMQDDLGQSQTALFRNAEVVATTDPRFPGEDALHIEGGFQYDISDNGQWIIFDTPHGVYRAMIPSPGAALLFVPGLWGVPRRRRGRDS